MQKEQNSIDMLSRHETAIKQLYELFADVFPEHRAFWQGMAEEEQKHSDSLQGISSKESLKKWFMNDSQFQQLVIIGSTEYIEQQIEKVKKAKIGLMQALSVASDIEEALIEKQFIRLNISGPEEIRNVMKGLVADTQRHRKMIAEKVNFLKRENAPVKRVHSIFDPI
jgi:rubrerythrin